MIQYDPRSLRRVLVVWRLCRFQNVLTTSLADQTKKTMMNNQAVVVLGNQLIISTDMIQLPFSG
jgi:uncharacterized protein YeeX (DUF496 family)